MVEISLPSLGSLQLKQKPLSPAAIQSYIHTDTAEFVFLCLQIEYVALCANTAYYKLMTPSSQSQLGNFRQSPEPEVYFFLFAELLFI